MSELSKLHRYTCMQLSALKTLRDEAAVELVRKDVKDVETSPKMLELPH